MEFFLSTSPGTVNISRFCSRAHFAVMRAPDFSGASIIIVATDSPLIILFLAGN